MPPVLTGGCLLSRFYDENDFRSNAVLYHNNQMIELGTLGGDYSIALDINNNGQIVGYAEDSQNREYATIFDPTGNGNNISLGSLDGKESLATAINDAGYVVGTLMRTDTDGSLLYDDSPFLYDGIQMVDLQDYIPLDSGWTLGVPWDINNNGQIVGWGYRADGIHQFLLNPISVPEPATLTILTIGALITRRRKQN